MGSLSNRKNDKIYIKTIDKFLELIGMQLTITLLYLKVTYFKFNKFL